MITGDCTSIEGTRQKVDAAHKQGTLRGPWTLYTLFRLASPSRCKGLTRARSSKLQTRHFGAQEASRSVLCMLALCDSTGDSKETPPPGSSSLRFGSSFLLFTMGRSLSLGLLLALVATCHGQTANSLNAKFGQASVAKPAPKDIPVRCLWAERGQAPCVVRPPRVCATHVGVGTDMAPERGRGAKAAADGVHLSMG